jgi:transposase
LEGNCTSEAFIDFLTKLMHDIVGPVFLVVDGHASHRSKATRAFVEAQGEKLSLFYLPPYSPELNPDEWVWKNVKCDHVAKVAPRTVGEMREAIETAITRLRDTPSIVKGFFGDPDLAYIGDWQ